MSQEITESEEKANLLVGVVKGDITKVQTQAIVTVIHSDLAIKGSLNEAIFAAAGPELDAFILENVIAPHVNDVFVVPGFDLPAKRIIFSIVPAWRSDLDIVDKHLTNAVRGIIETATKMGLTEISIPLICCGQKGYPLQRGIRLILQGIVDRISPPLQRINFVCDKDEAVQIYKKRLNI